jgi:hypothetical protein
VKLGRQLNRLAVIAATFTSTSFARPTGALSLPAGKEAASAYWIFKSSDIDVVQDEATHGTAFEPVVKGNPWVRMPPVTLVSKGEIEVPVERK